MGFDTGIYFRYFNILLLSLSLCKRDETHVFIRFIKTVIKVEGSMKVTLISWVVLWNLLSMTIMIHQIF